MATLGHAFAALVMKLSDRLSLQPSDFLAFPSFQTRLSLDQMEHVSSPEKQGTTEEGAAAKKRALSVEAFSRLVNHVPTGKRDFMLSGQPLWDVYQQILRNAETATKPEAKAGQAAVEFQDRKHAMMINERRSVSGISDGYWPVGVDPIVDLRDAQSWTRITLDQKAIKEITKTVPKDIEQWLEARDLLQALDAVEVRSMTLEACHLSIRRGWFDQNIFSARNWRFEDSSILSDGGNPPVGLLPAFVQGVVLIRKLEIELEPAAAAEATPSETQPQSLQKVLSAPLMLQRTFVMAAPRSLESFAKKPKPGIMALDKTATEAATAGFPSPVIIKAQSVIERLEKNMAAARLELEKVGQQLATQRSGLATSEAKATEIKRTLQRFPDNVNEVVIRDHRRRGGVSVTDAETGDAVVRSSRSVAKLIKARPRPAAKAAKKASKRSAKQSVRTTSSTTLDLKALRAQLASHTERINALKAEILKTEANQRSLNEKLNKWRDEKAGYEALSADPFGTDEVFLFAAVCRRTPKSPNPAPDLFSS